MVIYNIVVAKKFEKLGCLRVYVFYTQIKPHEKIEIFVFLNGGVYMYTCLHPNKIEIKSFVDILYNSSQSVYILGVSSIDRPCYFFQKMTLGVYLSKCYSQIKPH